MDFVDTLNAQVKLLQLQPNEVNEINKAEEVQKLKMMLDIRIKYSIPNKGGKWEFGEIPNDITVLREMIKFIDENSSHLNKDIKSRELTVDGIDELFNFCRFQNYQSFEKFGDELLECINSSLHYKHLRALFFDEILLNEFDEVPEDMKFLGPAASKIEYVEYYQLMNRRLKQWLLRFGLSEIETDEDISNLFKSSLKFSGILNYLIKNQNKSKQIQDLLLLLINKPDDALYLKDGFLPYITYMDHLTAIIENAIPNCRNPYKNIYLLQLTVQGMRSKPELLDMFGLLLGDFLTKYPNFTLYELSQYLKDHNLPDL